MGKGIDLARPYAPDHAAALDDLKDQLLIVFLRRLLGDGPQPDHSLDVPLSEIDEDTAHYMLSFSADDKSGQMVFHFSLHKKS